MPLEKSELRQRVLKRIRLVIALFIVGLVLSGLTAFPLLHELNLLASLIGTDEPISSGGLRWWILRVRDGLAATYRDHPFLGYGTDWLAFAHLVIAVFFIGPWRDPVRNVWVLQAGVIACIGVALICGPIRGIPLYWQLIDCSFGVFGVLPLWYALALTRGLQRIEHSSRTAPDRAAAV